MEIQFIDDRNRSLWKAITGKFSITIERHPGHHFYHRIIDKEVILYIPEEDATIELFTHELLHVYLVINGISIKSYLKERFRNEPLLHWSLTENLFEQVGDCLEHSKMLALYLSMGFERELFCETYYMLCCNEMSMQIIRSGMNKEIPTKISLHHFIHKYFAIKTCLNPLFNYDTELQELKSINGELYFVLEKFWTEWNALDTSNNSVPSFKSSTNNFIHDLGIWNILNIYAKQNIRA